jgi:hypothetical protein
MIDLEPDSNLSVDSVVVLERRRLNLLGRSPRGHLEEDWGSDEEDFDQGEDSDD